MPGADQVTDHFSIIDRTTGDTYVDADLPVRPEATPLERVFARARVAEGVRAALAQEGKVLESMYLGITVDDIFGPQPISWTPEQGQDGDGS